MQVTSTNGTYSLHHAGLEVIQAVIQEFEFDFIPPHTTAIQLHDGGQPLIELSPPFSNVLALFPSGIGLPLASTQLTHLTIRLIGATAPFPTLICRGLTSPNGPPSLEWLSQASGWTLDGDVLAFPVPHVSNPNLMNELRIARGMIGAQYSTHS